MASIAKLKSSIWWAKQVPASTPGAGRRDGTYPEARVDGIITVAGSDREIYEWITMAAWRAHNAAWYAAPPIGRQA
jgi:hypothetical protein